VNSAVPALRARPALALSAAARRAIGLAGIGGLVFFGGMIAIGGAGAPSFEVPAGKDGLPHWIAGPFHPLGLTIGGSAFWVALMAMCVSYAAVLAAGEALRLRWIGAAVVVLHVLFVLAPPLLSKDIFSYIEYARLGVVHHVNPYGHVVEAVKGDPVFPYLGWRKVASAYGPLFTVASYPLAHLSASAALWTIKGVTGLASLGCVALIADCTRRLGRSPVFGVTMFGLNPVLLAYGVGGAHNDFVLLTLALGAVLLALEERPFASGALGALAVGVKAPAALLLPFLLLSSRTPRRALAGMITGLAALFALAFAAFEREALGFVAQIREQQQFVAVYSVPNRVATWLGFDALPTGLRLLFALAFAAAVAGLLWATWRARIDWLTAAGWATLALLLSTAWLVPWYVVWLLPLAAVARDPRLRGATLLFCVYVVATRVAYQLA
jgi:glycosyl transferase family 87